MIKNEKLWSHIEV